MATDSIPPVPLDVNTVKDEGFYAKYIPKDILGYGATSVVRKCICQSTMKEYAVKIIEKTPTKEQEVRSEIFALSLLSDNPNIIGLIDVFENQNYFFLVFELAEGGELFDYLNKVITVSENQACSMMYEILKVVAHMHRLSIVHRDLKPENMLLTKDDHLLVSDFGFAVQLRPAQLLKDLCGTLDYLAPEVLRCSINDDHPGYGLEVDLWSCGVIAYLLLVGFSPFWHRKQNLMIWNIMDGKYNLDSPEWKNISDHPKDLISNLLVVDPAQRVSAYAALQHPWFEKIRVVPITIRKPHIRFKLLVETIIVLKRLQAISFQRMSVLTNEMVLQNPYSHRKLRKIIDTCAFSIYGHWIKRTTLQNQNRAAIFEVKPKTDLCDEERCILTRPYQYKLSFTNPTLLRKHT